MELCLKTSHRIKNKIAPFFFTRCSHQFISLHTHCSTTSCCISEDCRGGWWGAVLRSMKLPWVQLQPLCSSSSLFLVHAALSQHDASMQIIKQDWPKPAKYHISWSEDIKHQTVRPQSEHIFHLLCLRVTVCPFKSSPAVCSSLSSNPEQHPSSLQNKARHTEKTWWGITSQMSCFLSLSHTHTNMQMQIQPTRHFFFFSSWLFSFQLLLFKVKRNILSLYILFHFLSHCLTRQSNPKIRLK